MRILVSNDDGIHAPGLAVLERIVRTLSDDVWVVAPEQEQSGAAHSLTLHLPIRVRKLEEKRYAVSGTPTDCVLMALRHIIPSYFSSPYQGEGRVGVTQNNPHPDPLPKRERGQLVDLVLSGINNSSNIGDDITYSGTVAAAMEGTNLDVPSIALSQSCEDGSVRWQTSEHHAPEVIKQLVAAGWPKNTLINVNFPECAPDEVQGVRFCPQGKRLVNVALAERFDLKKRPYYWLGGDRDNTADKPGVDLALLAENYITITPLCMDLTDYKTMEELRGKCKF
jgi:5'-nucleotidase